MESKTKLLLAKIEDPLLREELSRSLERDGQLQRRTQLYIPEIGDVLKLTLPWTFTLYVEYRNKPLFKAMEIKSEGSFYDRENVRVALPPGTVLIVDRIYIRKGKGDYSSITFRSKIPGIKSKPRFWAKLSDVNQIIFEPMEQKNG